MSGLGKANQFLPLTFSNSAEERVQLGRRVLILVSSGSYIWFALDHVSGPCIWLDNVSSFIQLAERLNKQKLRCFFVCFLFWRKRNSFSCLQHQLLPESFQSTDLYFVILHNRLIPWNRSLYCTHSYRHRYGCRWGFSGDTNGKEPACQFRRHKRSGFDPWVEKTLWRRAWQTTAVFLPGKSHGQRSLAGYSPWGHKESDTIEVT